MPKKILTVGFDLAGDDIGSADFTEKKSLLDWEIVLFRPDVSYFIRHDYNNSDHMGKLALNDRSSFEMREANAHWRREIIQAVEAGKLVVGFLPPPVEVFAATGTKSTSGTGRNQKVTRHVEPVTSYDCLPVTTSWTATQGTAMTLAAAARDLLAPYWKLFGQSSRYNVVWDSNAKSVCVQTEHGKKPVGLFLRGKVSAGALLLLPDMDFIAEEFFDEDEEEGEVWSPAGERFSASLIGEIVALSKAIASDGEKTPQPEW